MHPFANLAIDKDKFLRRPGDGLNGMLGNGVAIVQNSHMRRKATLYQ